jgi:hypothetical protein
MVYNTRILLQGNQLFPDSSSSESEALVVEEHESFESAIQQTPSKVGGPSLSEASDDESMSASASEARDHQPCDEVKRQSMSSSSCELHDTQPAAGGNKKRKSLTRSESFDAGS